MSRVGFWAVFLQNPDGSIQAIKPIKLAGVVLNPNVKYSKGILFSGFDLFQFIGHDIELQDQPDNSAPVITRIY
jgi:hypothetical protein